MDKNLGVKKSGTSTSSVPHRVRPRVLGKLLSRVLHRVQKNERLPRLLLPALFILALLGLWQAGVDLGFIASPLFPSPIDILAEAMGDSELAGHVFSSLQRLVISLALGYVAGVGFGVLVSHIRYFRPLEEMFSFFMAIPGIGWAPLFIITIGFGDRTIITVGIITAFFPVVYNVMQGFKETRISYSHLGRILEYSRLEKLLLIKIPSITGYLLLAFKLSLARTWRTIIAVEMIAATMSGLGYMIFDAREFLDVVRMFEGIFVSGIIYVLVENTFIRLLERRTVERWGMKTA